MPKKKQKKYVWPVSAAIIVIVTALAWGPAKKYYFDKPPEISKPVIAQIDPICQYVENLQLRCLAAPSSEGLMGPGHYTRYSPSATNSKVAPLGNGNLFEPVCVVNGVPKAQEAVDALMAELKGQEQTNRIPFDEVTYRLDRAFQAGATLPIPKLANLELKAGPKLTEIQEISIKAPNAWVKIIDENRFIDILSNAAIKDTCIDQLIQQNYVVVSKAAIAQGYDIVVKEKSGQEFALSASIAKDQLQMTGGGNSNASVDETIKKSSLTPVVLGVDFFDVDFLSKNRAKLVAPIFAPTATTTARASAKSPQGALWRIEKVAPLGKPAPLARRGGGDAGVCGGGVPSTVQLTSSVSVNPVAAANLRARSFEFTTTGTISGGLSRVGGRRGPLGQVTGCQAQPTSVEAELSFDSTVNTTVRSETASTMNVEFDHVLGAEASVRDWTGRALPRKAQEVPNLNVIGFQLSGAGIYEVHVSGRRTVSSAGESTLSVNERGTFKISVQ